MDIYYFPSNGYFYLFMDFSDIFFISFWRGVKSISYFSFIKQGPRPTIAQRHGDVTQTINPWAVIEKV